MEISVYTKASDFIAEAAVLITLLGISYYAPAPLLNPCLNSRGSCIHANVGEIPLIKMF